MGGSCNCRLSASSLPQSIWPTGETKCWVHPRAAALKLTPALYCAMGSVATSHSKSADRHIYNAEPSFECFFRVLEFSIFLHIDSSCESELWFSATTASSNTLERLFLKCRNIIFFPADHPASLAVHRPVSGAAASGNHRSCHQGLQHSPSDPQLHQGRHRRQGKHPAAEPIQAGPARCIGGGRRWWRRGWWLPGSCVCRLWRWLAWRHTQSKTEDRSCWTCIWGKASQVGLRAPVEPSCPPRSSQIRGPANIRSCWSTRKSTVHVIKTRMFLFHVVKWTSQSG